MGFWRKGVIPLMFHENRRRTFDAGGGGGDDERRCPVGSDAVCDVFLRFVGGGLTS